MVHASKRKVPSLAESYYAPAFNNRVVDSNITTLLAKAIKDLYQLWNRNFCKGQWLTDVGSKDKPYFRFFANEDFLMPIIGLIQIRKYSEQENLPDLLDCFKEISLKIEILKEEMHRMLVWEISILSKNL